MITDPLDQCFLTPDFHSRVHGYYDMLRAEDPVHWSDVLGSWFLTRFDDIAAVHRDPKTFSSVFITTPRKPLSLRQQRKPLFLSVTQRLRRSSRQ